MRAVPSACKQACSEEQPDLEPGAVAVFHYITAAMLGAYVVDLGDCDAVIIEAASVHCLT